jgi:capsular polysaccharide biosynthesis protein
MAGGSGTSLVLYFRALWRGRWLIAVVCGGGLAVAAGLTVITPRAYESSITLLAPREGGGGAGALMTLAATGLLAQTPTFGLPSLTPNRDMVISLLKSRTVAQALVQQFGLKERYRVAYVQDAIGALRKVTSIVVSREGAISVRVEDTDPRMAADMANAYAMQVDRLVTEYGIGEAKGQRRFLIEQMARAKVQLDRSEEALRRFQERNKAIVLQDQTRGAIEAAARLKGEIIATEVQRQVMRSFATEANPEVIALGQRIDEMNRQLAQMQYGEGALRSGANQRSFAVPFAKVPEVGLELARLTRDVKVNETLVTLLTQQAEQARIAEARDLPVVQVLDLAVPAERASRPRLGLNLAFGLFIGMGLGIGFVLVRVALRDLRGRRNTTFA